MLGAAQVSLEDLEDEDFDAPLGIGTGAGVIFGVTGGVMEAALRSAYYFAEGKNPEPDEFSVVRGEKGIREVTVTIAGREVRAAVVTGLANAEKLMQRLRKGKARYDFVEVMACPGGWWAAAVSRFTMEWNWRRSVARDSMIWTRPARCVSPMKIPPSRMCTTISSDSPSPREPMTCFTPGRRTGQCE